MKASKVFKILMWSATEYLPGYEFPVWVKGKWKWVAQWKLEPFLDDKPTSKHLNTTVE